MSKQPAITITITGKTGVGKTTVSQMIAHTLQQKGITVSVEDDGHQYPSNTMFPDIRLAFIEADKEVLIKI